MIPSSKRPNTSLEGKTKGCSKQSQYCYYSKAFSKGTVYVSKNVLKAEALLRELLREIQSHRKLQKLIVEDKIVLYLDNDSMQEFEREIRDKVGAKNIIFGPIEKPTGQVQLEDEKVSFKIETLQKIYE